MRQHLPVRVPQVDRQERLQRRLLLRLKLLLEDLAKRPGQTISQVITFQHRIIIVSFGFSFVIL